MTNIVLKTWPKEHQYPPRSFHPTHGMLMATKHNASTTALAPHEALDRVTQGRDQRVHAASIRPSSKAAMAKLNGTAVPT